VPLLIRPLLLLWLLLLLLPLFSLVVCVTYWMWSNQ
jgi:hypothetical protein